MNRRSSARDTHLLWLILAAGCLVGLMWMGTGHAANAGLSSVPARVGLAMPPASHLGSQYHPGLKCTLSLTNTADFTGQNQSITFTNASSFPALASYSSLVLSIGNVPDPSSPQQYPAFDEYFRLDSATVGAIYKVDVMPGYTDNYNLGIIVYDRSFTVLLVDVNAQDGNTASVSLTANTIGPYYFRIVQLTPDCTGLSYQLRVTYTPSTATPTTIASPTVTGDVQDSFEPNETITNATPLNANSYTGLTLYHSSYPHPGDDQDWYSIFVGASQLGIKYTISFVSDGNLPVMDLGIYDPGKALRSQVFGSNNLSYSWTPTVAGAYYFYIRRSTNSPSTGLSTYHVSWSSPGPTATPTEGAVPTETPVPGLDAFEPNFDFDHAAGIGLNVKYTSINFVPLPGQTINNDFFKIRVKRGMLVTCETLDLSPGTDTNMILYDDNRQGLAGNDDVDKLLGDLRSRVTVSINFDGFLYILVGQGYAVPPSQSANYNYALQCTSGAGQASATPTSTQSPLVVPPTALPPALPPASSTPVPPPPTPMPPISVRPLPTPTPPGSVQQIVTADLRVSYDANGNGVADPGEGVIGLPIRVYDDVTGALLAQGFTDDSGRAVLSVPSAGPIRVVVPYLSFETTVQPGGAMIPVLISPRDLPDQIP